jgi:ribonuclease HI
VVRREGGTISLMIRLPLNLERRLKELFPRAREREQFVAEVLLEALEEKRDDHLPKAVGGTLHLYTDGGSRGNPGEAAIGIVLLDPQSGRILEEEGEAIGVHTNNVAEYRALIAGLERAWKYHPNHLVCHLDSELIVKQLAGEYRVRVVALQPLLEEIQELLRGFKDVSFCHVSRERNARADRLVNQALDHLLR